MPVFEIEANGKTYEVDAPSMEAAAAAFGSQQKATPPPQSATLGMIAPSTPTSQPATGTLMDLIPKGEDRSRELGMMVDAMPLPSPGAMVGAAKSVPGVIARAAGISKARAVTNLGEAAAAAGGAALNTERVGQEGLRAMDLQATGGRMPRVVSQLMQRITSPNAGELTFNEARDFYNNISRLSANEFNTLNPVMQRQIGLMKQALHEALVGAADTVGKGEQYAKGVSEYAKAGRFAHSVENAKPMLKKAIGRGAGAIGLGWLAKEGWDLFD